MLAFFRADYPGVASIITAIRSTIAALLMAAVAGCGGSGGDTAFTAPGIDSGSVSGSTSASGAQLQIGEALAGSANAPLDDHFDAVRFLHRASFGPTSEEIEHLQAVGYTNWIAEQMQLPATYLLPETRDRSEPRWREQVNSWLTVSTVAEDQLRQRVAFALSQFFVVSGQGDLAENPAALSNYYDILLANSFGNFRQLLEQVTLSPVMGSYLSMKGNQKPDPEKNIRPDENYARELLQLFSIGLVQLNIDGTVKTDASGIPLPTYDQAIVEAFAHVFTGWHFKDVDNWNYPDVEDWFSPMQAYPERHDTGEKTLLNGRVLPAGQSPEQDMQDALNNIFNHPNVGPFFSSHLIRQLVTSNPSPAYVARVANVFNADSSGIRGNLSAVVTAILTDQEALSGHATDPDNFGKLREPLIRLIALWRAFGGNPDHPDFNYGWIDGRLAQAPLQAPSVFNFFSPDFAQTGTIRDRGMVSPEFQIHNESTVISITSALLAHSIWNNTVSGTDPKHAPVDISTLMNLDDNTDQQLSYLARLTLTKPISAGLKRQALYLLDERRNSSSQIRAEELLFLFISSPEAAIQH